MNLNHKPRKYDGAWERISSDFSYSNIQLLRKTHASSHLHNADCFLTPDPHKFKAHLDFSSCPLLMCPFWPGPSTYILTDSGECQPPFHMSTHKHPSTVTSFSHSAEYLHWDSWSCLSFSPYDHKDALLQMNSQRLSFSCAALPHVGSCVFIATQGRRQSTSQFLIPSPSGRLWCSAPLSPEASVFPPLLD
jgi:hypothetical protein